MKTKISKILGVSLALVLVFSLAFAILPSKAQADEGNMAWVGQPLPTAAYAVLAAGTDVTEVAVGPDGMTMYAIDGTEALDGSGATGISIYKSMDGGQTWLGLAAVPGAIAFPPGNVAVAPDNANVLAVACFDVASGQDDIVYISTDGGVTWATLPALVNNDVLAGALRVLDLKIGPARSGTIYGRDYMVATADDDTATAAGILAGSLQILGETATWTVADDLAAAANTGTTADFIACEFSPNFVGDRIIFGVGNPGAATNFYTYNVQNYSVTLPTLVHAAVNLDAVATDYDLAVGANAVVIGDIAVPSNFDITPGFERAYASVATTALTNNGVWRCDSVLAPTELGMTATPIRSIAYTGDTANGTLFAGQYIGAVLATQVWSTTQMTTNLPAWYPSFKPATGFVAAVAAFPGGAYVRLSPNYSADNKVFCGTTDAGAGLESAFSVSTNAGLTFDQEALVDSIAANTVVKIDAIQLSPDGAKLYVATDDATHLSLWETATPPSPFSWKRIFCFAGNNGTLAINKATWADAPEIYFAETPPVANRLYASYDGGNIFNTRSAPVIGAGNTINFMAVESSKVLFMAVGATGAVANVYKSTNGGSVWSPARPALVGNIWSVIPAPGGDVLVGGSAGLASISVDGGTTFAQLPPGLNPAGNYVVIPDEGYAENGYIYGGSVVALGAGVSSFFRLKVGTDFLWENLANPTTNAGFVGMGMSNGTLYGMTAAAGADRTLVPHFAVGDQVWTTMSIGAPAAAAFFDLGQNKAYAANATVGLWAYNDYYATSSTTINTPASGAVIPVDPVTGRANTLPFTWSAVGSGTGLATNYLFAIFETSQGFPGAQIVATGAMPLPSAPSNAVYPVGVAAAAAPDINYTFLAGVEYGVMISALNQVSGDLVSSQWSDPVIFSIEAGSGIISPTHAGPELTSPTPGDQEVDPGCAFSWNPMAGVTEYELIIATDSALTSPVAGTPVTLATTSYGPVELDYSTDYYYAVQATAPTSSVQTVGAFRTMDEPVEKYTCEYCGLTFDTRAELEAHIAAAHAAVTPLYIWIVIAIGAILVIAVIWLIFTTRRA
jgi:hypothetical protein